MNMEKYTIKRRKLDAYSPELDSTEEIAKIECTLSVAKMICYSLSYGEAWEGDPYVSYLLFDSNGEEIKIRKTEDV
jgi:hypothetical protein